MTEIDDLFNSLREVNPDAEETNNDEPEDLINRDDPELIPFHDQQYGHPSDTYGIANAQGTHIEEDSNLDDIFDFTEEASESYAHDDTDKKRTYYTQYKEYLVYLRNEGIDTADIPQITIDNNLEEIKNAHDLAKFMYGKSAGSSLTREILYSGCNLLGDIFDGNMEIAGCRPNLKGWGDDVLYRLNTDPDLKRSVSQCGVNISNPFLNIAITLGISMFTYSRHNSSNKKTNSNISNIRRATLNLDDL